MSRCRSCKAPIKWVKTASGKAMPVDLDDSWLPGEIFNPATMTSHFATCPNADKHRKPREKKA